MGLDPFSFADALLGVLAQRLVRTLCKKCKEAYHPTLEEYNKIVSFYGAELFEELNAPYDDKFVLYRPKGCKDCNSTGYRGRMGIHELLAASENIKRQVAKRETVDLLRETALSQGMRTLLQDGISKVISGHTDFKQVLGVCMR